MITKQDSLQLQKDFRKIFATKDELKARFDEVMNEIKIIKKNYQKMSNDNLVMKSDLMNEIQIIKRNYKKMSNDNATMHSDLMGELQAIREE